jgi:D-alanyl-lipoteichoic acid acyltransferase DltB (MBOAT superfamily)
MGPIDRASKFLPQIEKDYSLTKDQIGKALFLILCGLFKKFVIADYVSLNFTDRVYDAPFLYTGVENLIAIYGSLLQVYCDFSGYTDMALGVALLLGFEMMDNFRRPFKASSIADFWRRWHISLSSWMLEYLFRPLQIKFRNMKMYGVALAVLITFFIIGLWHGPNFTFIFFGLLHSFYIIFSMFTQKYRNKFYDMLGWRNSKTLKIFQIFFTFNLIAFASMFFKVPSFSFAMDMMKQIFYAFHPEVFMQFISAYSVITFLIVLGYSLHFLPDSLEVKTQKIIAKLPLAVQALLFTLMIWLVVQVKFTDMQRFIYFDF